MNSPACEGHTEVAEVHPAQVTFVSRGSAPESLTVKAATGRSLLQAAQGAGVDIVATCGGRGRCRSCRVKVLQGDVPPATMQDQIQLGHEAVRERFRLSCQTKLIGDCTVMVASPNSETGHQILGAGARTHAEAAHASPDSGVEKHVLAVRAPTGAEGDVAEVEGVLERLGERVRGALPLELLRNLPSMLRAQGGVLTVTTFNGEILDMEPGDTSALKFGMAFDVGTTTIVGTLLDLATGEQLAAVSDVNPQAVYGGDVMSRIAFAQFDEKKTATLRARALNALNGLVAEACRKAGVAAEHIYKMVVVGNTCMHHMLLGIDTSYLGMSPYAPVVRTPVVLESKELGLKSVPHARVCLLPLVAGFVGADTVAAVLASRLHESEEIRVLVDIGTNGEVVMGSRDRLIACSAPAGPAFEGGQVAHGMRAALGAIEAVDIGADAVCKVIGDVPAVGICGSGLIDAAAKMLDAGLLDASGALGRGEALPPQLEARLSTEDERPVFVLLEAARAGKGEDITITQGDVRQLQLAKAAIYSGILMLQDVMGIPDEGIEELMLAGGFGNYISVDSAVRISLLPPLPRERISYIGNAAHTGAELALISEAARHEAAAIARRIEHVGLADHPRFQELFVDAMGFSEPGRRVPDEAR